MLRIRLLFAWLVLAAIPLQGFAAASMLFCGMPQNPPQAQAQVMSKASTAHDHTTHGHASPEAKLKQAQDAKQQLPDSGHSCGVCAACSHTGAITETPATLPVATLPQSDAAEPFVLIHARASPVPDKPPRL